MIYSFASGQYQVATELGNAPLWLADSRRLLFNHNGKLYLFDTVTKRVRQILSLPQREINPWLFGHHPMMPPRVPDGYTWGLALLYLVFAVVVALLYGPCRWFAGVKARRPDGFVQYL